MSHQANYIAAKTTTANGKTSIIRSILRAYGVGGERVVLARKDPRTMVGFQWTGQEPAGLNEVEFAEALGAVWEGEQLVTYNLCAFTHAFGHYSDEYLTDPD